MQSVNCLPIIPDRLYFTITRITQRSKPTMFSYSIDTDEEYQYYPFFSDFGPLSLLQIHKFRLLTNKILNEHAEKVQFFTNLNQHTIANASLLLASYLLIEQHLTPEEALKPLSTILPTLKPYRDASSLPSKYSLTVGSCIKGLYHAMQIGWYNPDNFDAQDWKKYEQVENGDMNWLIPNKLLAFASPYATNCIRGGWRVATPQDLVPVFAEKKITRVVRLCQKFYDEEIFKRASFEHTELYFLDGSTPPPEILTQWLKIIEGSDIVALHCKAGLGRTGTLAACYMIKDFGFTGHEAIGWIRLCRPGSIIGDQQDYVLKYYENISGKTAKTVKTPKISSEDEVSHAPTKVLRNALKKDIPHKTSAASIYDRNSMTSGLQVTGVHLTPKTPQPRKYNRSNSVVRK
ncbi:Dual specificity protein phosphatase CDC14A, putative [Trichomonas vaginalis G3]|uniref:protein-tyrosine-phosphatase n=1 Tax=Trichomonas vaginalis (strain ATCC PRA-98 / G3) TaxID=412133 RepID=A2FHE7_TRIV3|nr:protein tyrosine/serine/threonine phosphatase protein [Trichomonas vaginalis G3]EAX95664.1 Dual specificity protein phosphatase CDC14A, putative [Trichomonas vaginalis G3]KAI5538166.1 protein tyrosine/serine/threonine phosphatase protein [Trichomonas vaginalis G3]|eukprot:XP_001308594.1 Dual specificity protein phosphatase CDC14A [Trichomonas vaginalis G3]